MTAAEPETLLWYNPPPTHTRQAMYRYIKLQWNKVVMLKKCGNLCLNPDFSPASLMRHGLTADNSDVHCMYYLLSRKSSLSFDPEKLVQLA